MPTFAESDVNAIIQHIKDSITDTGAFRHLKTPPAQPALTEALMRL